MTIHVTSGNYEEEILDSTEPVLIDFYADWCGPCQMLKPVIEQISEEAEHTKIVKINIDEEPQLAGMFQVMSIPTLVYMQNGSIQGSVSGYHSLGQIKSWIGELHAVLQTTPKVEANSMKEGMVLKHSEKCRRSSVTSNS